MRVAGLNTPFPRHSAGNSPRSSNTLARLAGGRAGAPGGPGQIVTAAAKTRASRSAAAAASRQASSSSTKQRGEQPDHENYPYCRAGRRPIQPAWCGWRPWPPLCRGPLLAGPAHLQKVEFPQTHCPEDVFQLLAHLGRGPAHTASQADGKLADEVTESFARPGHGPVPPGVIGRHERLHGRPCFQTEPLSGTDPGEPFGKA